LKLGPPNADLPMLLARAQVAGGKTTEALATLEQGLATAGDAADYHAFYAALLQKQGRHDQAVNHYITALRSDPMQPNWLIGVGISLRATNRLNDAAEAFQRAISSGELTPQVAEFASQQLSQISPRR
jgi:MSHA biogenesis protein MshN